MENFPAWAQKLLQPGEQRQRPHVLNLALVLKEPRKLPLMLLDVATAQPEIQRALKDLAFLHYARFVPSYDGNALMVITEFDGPFKAYVMDFVIALGDLFNKLLAYCKYPPKRLPVQQYPDDFWTFVELWNRVPFLPRTGDSDRPVFPASYDYPVYAAYPDKTVIDIVGARDAELHGLRPTLDRKATKVDLGDVQGNILRGYHLLSTRHLMLKVTDAAKARAWLAGLPVQDGAAWVAPPAQGLLNVAVTFEGLSALLPARQADLAKFPEAFRKGARSRAEANGDRAGKPGLPSSAPDSWRFGGTSPATGPVHVLLSLHRLNPGTLHAAMPEATFEQQYATLKQQAQQNGLTALHEERADALEGDRMYFDYRDGISEPRIAGQCPAHGERLSMEPASSPGEFLLGKGYHSIYKGPSLSEDMPADLAENGCYGALRLIEQDETAFNKLTHDLAAKFACSEKEAAARLLGRWHDGQPLSLYDTDPGSLPGGKPRNDFDYTFNWEYPKEIEDHAGKRCPLDAHIRRSNPRSHHTAGMRHTRRLLRRGLPATWKAADGTPRVGLMGLFLCADLERQFEFIQREWIQGGERGQSDALAGVRSGNTKFRWAPDTDEVDIPPLVYTRGSLYLFYPSISVLKKLPALSAPPAPAPPPSARQRFDDLVDLLKARLDDLHVPALFTQPAIEFLSTYLEHSTQLERFTEAMKPLAPPDLSQVPPAQQVKVGALSTAFIADPCEHAYRWRREQAPPQSFFWEENHRAFWALSRTDASRIVANDQEFVQAPSTTGLRGIITLDGAAHQAVRKAFWDSMQAPMANVADDLDAALAAQLQQLDGLAQFDFVRDLSNPVLSRVFWQLFGLSEDRQATCTRHAAMAMRQFNQPVPLRGAAQAAGANATARLFGNLALELGLAMLRDVLPLPGNPYKDTLLGGIAERTKLFPGLPPGVSPKRTLDFPTAVTSLLQFVLAGHLAPQLLLGSSTRNFLKHPTVPGTSVWAHLAGLPANERNAPLKTALEEARRFDPPVTIIQRYTKGIVDIGGLRLQPDTPVFAVIASANRDGPAAEKLNDFQWDRTPSLPHFSLGDGPHVCIGAQMQAAMVPQMLSTLMDRIPNLRLVDPQAVPAWIDNIYFRGLESLPVTRC